MNQGMAGDDLRPDLHAAAIDALAASPLPALLAEVETLRKAVLGTDPRALRRSVGWLGRLLGRDIALQAEAEDVRARLGVHVIAARGRLDQLSAHRGHLSGLRDQLLQAASRLAAQADALAMRADPGDQSGRRAQHLLSTAHAYRITASHLDMSLLNLAPLLDRVGMLMPRVQLLLDQERMLRDGVGPRAALASATDALDAMHRLVHDNLPDPAPDTPATTRSTP